MKKILSFFAGALLLTACSNDDFAPAGVEGQEQEVSITLDLPQINVASRAVGGSNSAEGAVTNCTDKALTFNVALYYVAKDGDANEAAAWSASTTVAAGASKATFNPTLVIGKDYKIVAYASYDNSQDWSADAPKQVTATAAINDESKDAYFCVETIKAEPQMYALLKRPYGKLRIVTQDWQEALKQFNNAETISKITITYNEGRQETLVFDINGDASNQEFAEVTATESTLEDTDFANFNYTNESGETKTLLVDYIAAPADGTAKLLNFTVNVEFNNGETYSREFTQDIPVKRNYLTTLVGNFFTSVAELVVEVDNAFEGEEIIDMWDGNSVEEVTPNEEGVYEIANGAQLAWLAQQVNSKVTFKNEKVVLTADIDLGSNAWTPIGATGDVNGFQGTFDGQGHTIANLYIDQTDPQAYQSAGLFGCIAYGTVTNFTVENAVVKNYTTGSQTSCGTAVVVGSVNSGANQATISNITVKNAEVSSNRYVGGILGYGAATISGCTVDGIELVATPDDADNDGLYDNGDKVGGILAYANGAVTLTDNSVSNFKATAYREVGGIAGCVLNSSSVVTGNKVNIGAILIDQSVAYEEVRDAFPGEIVGRQAKDLDLTSNTASDVTISYAVTGTGLAAALEAAADQESATITLVGEVTWQTGADHGSTPWVAEGVALKNLVVEGNGNAALVATGAGIGAIRAANGGTITFKNLKVVDKSVSYAEGNWEHGYLEFAGALKFENCEFVNAIMACGKSNNNSSVLNAEFVNCTFNSNNTQEYDVWVDGDNASFTGCKFLGYRGLKMHEVYGTNIAQVIVDGNSFGPLSKKPGIAIGDVDASTVVTIVNNTFTDCQPGDQGNYMYESDTDVTTFQFTCENNKVVNSVNSTEEFEAALAAGDPVIYLGAGEYSFATNQGITCSNGTTVTFVGVGDDVTLAFSEEAGWESNGGLNAYANGLDLVFNNLKIVSNQTTPYIGGFGHAKSVTFNECTYIGQFRASSAVTTFNDCTIDPQASYIYTDYADANFYGCTFNCSEGKGIQVYNDGKETNTIVTVQDCKFIAAKVGNTFDGKPVTAIDINSDGEKFSVNVTNTTAAGFGTGQYSNSTLWNIKGGAENVKVNIDGTQVH